MTENQKLNDHLPSPLHLIWTFAGEGLMLQLEFAELRTEYHELMAIYNFFYIELRDTVENV